VADACAGHAGGASRFPAKNPGIQTVKLPWDDVIAKLLQRATDSIALNQTLYRQELGMNCHRELRSALCP